MAIGWISSISMFVLSPGMTISWPSGSFTAPVTSVVEVNCGDSLLKNGGDRRGEASGRPEMVMPGDNTNMEIELIPADRHGLWSPLRDPRGRPHRRRGVVTEIVK